MKKILKKYVTTFPMFAMALAFSVSSLAYVEFNKANGRNLSGTDKEFEITLNNIKLDMASRLHNKDAIFLRLRFDENSALEIGRGQGWKLARGQQVQVDQKIAVDSQFIKNDETKFTLDLVFEQSVWGFTKADVTLLTCNTVAKELTAYNRSYQCFVPGEKTAVLTYRLAEKGVPVPSAQGDSQMASN